MGYEIHLIDLPRQPAAVVRAQVAPPDLGEFLGNAFEEVLAVAGHQGRAPAGPPFGRYVPNADGFEVTAGFPVDGEVSASGRVTPDALPGGTVATTLHTGAYDAVAAAYEATTAWPPTTGSRRPARRGRATSTARTWRCRAPRSTCRAGRGPDDAAVLAPGRAPRRADATTSCRRRTPRRGRRTRPWSSSSGSVPTSSRSPSTSASSTSPPGPGGSPCCSDELALNRRLAPDVYLGISDVLDVDGRPLDHLLVMRRMPEQRRLAHLVRTGADVGRAPGRPRAPDGHLPRPLPAGPRRRRRAAPVTPLRARWQSNLDGVAALRRQPAGRRGRSRRSGPWSSGTSTAGRACSTTASARRRSWTGTGTCSPRTSSASPTAPGSSTASSSTTGCATSTGSTTSPAWPWTWSGSARPSPPRASLAGLRRPHGRHRPRRPCAPLHRLPGLHAGQGRLPPARAGHLRRRAPRPSCWTSPTATSGRGACPWSWSAAPPGTGKSTLSTRLADALGCAVLSSDRVRKELAGLPADDPRAGGRGAGHLHAEWTDRTYRELLRRAEATAGDGRDGRPGRDLGGRRHARAGGRPGRSAPRAT